MRKTKISTKIFPAALVLSLMISLCGCDDILSGDESSSAGGASAVSLSTDDISDYSGVIFTTINNNEPYFSDDELTTDAFENYSTKDSLGRCGVAFANVCEETMPTEKRGEIGMIRPSGWKTAKYTNIVEGNYLYNRSHLIAYMLTGENANDKNLITGTRWFNAQGMLPFETAVADYVDDTNNHVLYRVTPVYDGDDLVASGVEIEAKSVEDDAVSFNVFVYNIQPGITIDYATGDSSLDDDFEAEIEEASEIYSVTESEFEDIVDGSLTEVSVTDEAANEDDTQENDKEITYILNTNTKKFHLPSCPSVSEMSKKHKKEFTGVRYELIAEGYSPCGECNP